MDQMIDIHIPGGGQELQEQDQVLEEQEFMGQDQVLEEQEFVEQDRIPGDQEFQEQDRILEDKEFHQGQYRVLEEQEFMGQDQVLEEQEFMEQDRIPGDQEFQEQDRILEDKEFHQGQYRVLEEQGFMEQARSPGDREFQEEDRTRGEEDEECFHDQELVQPDIYSFVGNDDEDLHSPIRHTNPPSGSRPTGNSDPVITIPPPVHIFTDEALPAKRRRVLGDLDLQQVPLSRNSQGSGNTSGVIAFTKTNISVNRSDDGFRYVPSGGGGCIANMDVKHNYDTSPFSSSSKSSERDCKQITGVGRMQSTSKIGGDHFLQTHCAIRVDPRQCLRMGLSKRIRIPPLHPQIRRSSRNDENKIESHETSMMLDDGETYD